MNYDIEWQKVLFTQIDNAVPCDVDAHPPGDRTLPYVQIGETTLEDHQIGRVIFADVHTWSDAEGPHVVKSLQNQIRVALHALSFTGGGYSFSCCREQDCRVFRDTEDEIWHGVQTFRVLASS